MPKAALKLVSKGSGPTDPHQTTPPNRPWLYKPGQSGNPSGRPVGSKNKLGEAFVKALHDDFELHGVGAIKLARAEDPVQYLKVIASVIPRDLVINDNLYEDMTDAELATTIAAVRRLTAESSREKTGRGKGKTRRSRKVRR